MSRFTDSEYFELKVCVALIVLVIFAGLAFSIFAAAQESRVYNQLTGAHTTTWDAFWVELRVQEGTTR